MVTIHAKELLNYLDTAPPLPTRRPPSAHIPSTHPHSRKISVATSIASSPPATPLSLSPGELRPIRESPTSTLPEAGPSRPSNRTTASRSVVDLNDDDESWTSSEITALRSRPHLSPSPSSPLSQSRTPSYHNAYGASFLGIRGPPSNPPPPLHPSIRQQEPRGMATILWAYTHLVAHFHPSNTYIPPDPLLPLRSMLLYQPVGSGALVPSSSMSSVESGMKSSSSRWQLSFGTGTIGNSTQPSLTGSLFGLASSLVNGGAGGSLEKERKRVWNMKDLPVLETSRSLLGVDVRLKEGEARECRSVRKPNRHYSSFCMHSRLHPPTTP